MNEIFVNMVFGVEWVVCYVFVFVECWCKKLIFVYKINVFVYVGVIW